jgi:hypothetical protein
MKVSVTAADRMGVWDVAYDLLDEGDILSAVALLFAELPDRLSIACGACAASVDSLCREQAMRTCRYCAGTGKRNSYLIGSGRGEPAQHLIVTCEDCGGRGEREIEVERVLPHQSRILGIARRW